MPGTLVSLYLPVKGRSVAPSRQTWNCSSESCSRQASSGFSSFSIGTPPKGLLPFRRGPRCCAKSRQARRGTQAMVAPLPSSTTPHGEICRATRGPGLFLRDAAFLVAYLEHQTSLLVPCLAQKQATA